MLSLRHGLQPSSHFIEAFHGLDCANMAGRDLEGDNVGPEIRPRHWRFGTMGRYRLGLNKVTVIVYLAKCDTDRVSDPEDVFPDVGRCQDEISLTFPEKRPRSGKNQRLILSSVSQGEEWRAVDQRVARE